ncbi:Uncharacterised protein [Escherichia coli]|nr:Uncharacterised protein [Escherichia coli]
MTTTIRFVIGFCEVRLRFRQLSLCVQLGDLKGRFIDREQKIPRVNQLVVFYIQLNNTSRHLWGDRNLFCAYFPVGVSTEIACNNSTATIRQEPQLSLQ